MWGEPHNLPLIGGAVGTSGAPSKASDRQQPGSFQRRPRKRDDSARMSHHTWGWPADVFRFPLRAGFVEVFRFPLRAGVELVRFQLQAPVHVFQFQPRAGYLHIFRAQAGPALVAFFGAKLGSGPVRSFAADLRSPSDLLTTCAQRRRTVRPGASGWRSDPGTESCLCSPEDLRRPGTPYERLHPLQPWINMDISVGGNHPTARCRRIPHRQRTHGAGHPPSPARGAQAHGNAVKEMRS
jgi:hypothetical protein